MNSPKLLRPCKRSDQMVFLIRCGFGYYIDRPCSLTAGEEVVRSTVQQKLNTAGYVVSFSIVRRKMRPLGDILIARNRLENAKAFRGIDGQAFPG